MPVDPLLFNTTECDFYRKWLDGWASAKKITTYGANVIMTHWLFWLQPLVAYFTICVVCYVSVVACSRNQPSTPVRASERKSMFSVRMPRCFCLFSKQPLFCKYHNVLYRFQIPNNLQIYSLAIMLKSTLFSVIICAVRCEAQLSTAPYSEECIITVNSVLKAIMAIIQQFHCFHDIKCFL